MNGWDLISYQDELDYSFLEIMNQYRWDLISYQDELDLPLLVRHVHPSWDLISYQDELDLSGFCYNLQKTLGFDLLSR